MERRFTTQDGLSLAFEDSGTGLPLLCLPGLTRNARDFDDLRAVVPDGLRMIVLTSRGRGTSDRAPDPAQYAVPVEARDALDLLDHLGLEKVTIVGTSRGGIIAMLLALTAKDRLAGVLLNDIGPEIATEGLDVIYDYIGRPPSGANYDEVAQTLKGNMGEAFPGLSDARWRTLAERWFVEQSDGIGLRYDPKLRDAVLAQAAQEQPDLWPFFDALAPLPVAVVRGANSDLLTAQTVAKMAERRPDLIVETVPDRGHVPFLDEPEAIRALTRLVDAVQ